MIASGLAALRVHSLLHHSPGAVAGDDEAVQIEVKAVLDRGTVHLGDESARACQLIPVQAGLLPHPQKLIGGVARMPAAATANVDAQLVLQWAHSTLQGTHDAGGDSRRMPV